MPRCIHNLKAIGEYGREIGSLKTPETLVDICPGDFLTRNTDSDGESEAKLLSAFTWDTNLATTRVAAKAAFYGVSLGEVENNDCMQNDDCIPVAQYRVGNGWLGNYEIVNDAGAAAPTTWVKGQKFTFAKNPSSNALVNNKIVKTSTTNQVVFEAVEDSGPDNQTHALVKFA